MNQIKYMIRSVARYGNRDRERPLTCCLAEDLRELLINSRSVHFLRSKTPMKFQLTSEVWNI